MTRQTHVAQRPLIIGLTGGIGSGKSAAMSYFLDLGAPCIDADHVAREVVEPRQPALETITRRYGKKLQLPDGSLDRAQLRTIVFSSTAEKQWLENLLHPLINERIRHWLATCREPYAVLCSPLLLETGQHKLVDRILLIDVPEDIQISRTAARDGNTAEQVKKIINSQMSRSLKQEKADDIILNDKGLSHLKAQISKAHNDYMQLADRH